MTGIPATWPEVQRQFEATPPENIREVYDHFFARFTLHDPTPLQFAHPLAPCLEVASMCALFGREPEAVEARSRLVPHVQAILDCRLRGMDQLIRPRLRALSFLNLQALAGDPVLERAEPAALLARMAAVEDPQDDESRGVGWASLAFGVTEGLGELLVFDPVRAGAPDPEAHFEFNQHGLQRHLAQALVHGAGEGAVMRAWRDYLWLFPRLKGANASTYGELLMAARAVHTAVGGAPATTVLPWLRAQLGLRTPAPLRPPRRTRPSLP